MLVTLTADRQRRYSGYRNACGHDRRRCRSCGESGRYGSYPLPDFDLFGPPPIKIRLEPWDLAWFAATFGDLADPDVMSRAWQ
jgi:hypothetical protein